MDNYTFSGQCNLLLGIIGSVLINIDIIIIIIIIIVFLNVISYHTFSICFILLFVFCVYLWFYAISVNGRITYLYLCNTLTNAQQQNLFYRTLLIPTYFGCYCSHHQGAFTRMQVK